MRCGAQPTQLAQGAIAPHTFMPVTLSRPSRVRGPCNVRITDMCTLWRTLPPASPDEARPGPSTWPALQGCGGKTARAKGVKNH